jgi:hypothetical protein
MYGDAVQKGTYRGEKLMGRCDVLDLELVAIMERKIWFLPNGVVHGGEFTHPQQVFREANTSIEDFRRIARIGLIVRSRIHTVFPTLWQPPLTGCLKLIEMKLWIRNMAKLDLGLLLGITMELS